MLRPTIFGYALVIPMLVLFPPIVLSAVLGLEPGNHRLCNDDIGVILWGPDAAPTLSIGKSDVWDRRNPIPPQPILTMQQMMEKAEAGDPQVINGAAYYSSYDSYDFPCPKPVGQLILQLPFLNPDGRLEFKKNETHFLLSAKNQNKSLELKIYVSAVRNLIVIEGISNNLAEGDLRIRLYRHQDTIVPGGTLHPTIGGKKSPTDFEQLPMPRVGQEKAMIWLAQDFPADCTFPQGFTSVLAAQAANASQVIDIQIGKTGLGIPMIAEKEGKLSHGEYKYFTQINQAKGAAVTAQLQVVPKNFVIWVTAVTTQDDPDPIQKAKKVINEAIHMGSQQIWKEHNRQWEEYNTRPRAKIWADDGTYNLEMVWGGNPYRPRPSGYYGDIPFCSVDSTKYCFQDSSMWHADFHFNEVESINQQILRQYDYMTPYFHMINTMLPMAQANAREVYNCRGAMYPLVHYPLKAETVIHTHLTWEQSMEITAMLIKPLWLRFLYTWDLQFLQDTAYPVMREGARFYADYLKKGEDGLYHVFPTVSPEHRGMTQNLTMNHDSQSGITLIRYHLRATAKAAQLLQVDLDEAKQWNEIAEHMPDYPTWESVEGPIFVDVAGATPIEYNIPVPLSSIFWGDDIGLDSATEQLELAKRTLRLINVWVPHRGYLKTIKTRLGIFDPADGYNVQNFIQSHSGILHVFPVVPEHFSGGFSNLGAQGAFVVSAMRNPQTVEWITIESLAGNPCGLSNPWPGKTVTIIDKTNQEKTQIQNSPYLLQISTVKSHNYQLESR